MLTMLALCEHPQRGSFVIACSALKRLFWSFTASLTHKHGSLTSETRRARGVQRVVLIRSSC